MIHTGNGAKDTKSLFGTISVSPPSHETMKTRKREAGAVLENIAKRSYVAATSEEVARVTRKQDTITSTTTPHQPPFSNCYIICGVDNGLVLRQCRIYTTQFHHTCGNHKLGKVCDNCLLGTIQPNDTSNLLKSNLSPSAVTYDPC